MTPFLDGLTAEYDCIAVMGDLNFGMLDISNTGNSLSHVCDLFDLHNIIDKPTCFKTPTGTILDVILTPNSRSMCTQGVVETGLSDWHRFIYMVTKVHAPKITHRNVTYRSYKTFNEEKYLQDLHNAPFHIADIFTNIDDHDGFFETLYTNIRSNDHAPLKIKR